VWPMLFGTVTVALAWVALARLILIPSGWHAPVLWPAALLAAILACMQALFWIPLGLPYLRVALVLVFLPGLLGPGVRAGSLGFTELGVSGIFMAPIVASGSLSVFGVPRPRRGDELQWRWRPARSRAASSASHEPSRPFASPAQAQLWLEGRRNG